MVKPSIMNQSCRLPQLSRRQSGRITAIHTEDDVLRNGLFEQGFTEGTEVEVLERGALGGTPLSIRVGRAIVALRRREAEAVEVTRI